MGRYLRTLALVVASLFLATSCAHRAEMSREQRRECRRLRTKAALAGVGVTVGMAVVATAVLVVAVASRGNIGSSSGGGGSSRRRARRRERRERRHQVCYETLQSAPTESAEEEAEPVVAPVPEPPPARPAQTAPTIPEPPSEEVLAATFERIEPKVRECLGVGPVVEVDVAIDGQSGRVTGYAVHGMSVNPAQSQCLIHQLQRMRFQPFQDELRVRFALDLAWVPPAPTTSAPPPPGTHAAPAAP